MMHTGKVIEYYFIRLYWNFDTDMSTQNVFIFWTSPLFHEFICRTLKHPKIKFVGATSDYAAISADLVKIKPDTILIEDLGEHHYEMVREYLDTFPWAIKIILLSFNDKKLLVYHHEERSMVQTEDLLELILSELR